MASSQLVLSNALCFLTCRFGKISVQQLKCVVGEFYKDEELISYCCKRTALRGC